MWKCLGNKLVLIHYNILQRYIPFQLKGFGVVLGPRNFNPIVNIDTNNYLRIKRAVSH